MLFFWDASIFSASSNILLGEPMADEHCGSRCPAFSSVPWLLRRDALGDWMRCLLVGLLQMVLLGDPTGELLRDLLLWRRWEGSLSKCAPRLVCGLRVPAVLWEAVGLAASTFIFCWLASGLPGCAAAGAAPPGAVSGAAAVAGPPMFQNCGLL